MTINFQPIEIIFYILAIFYFFVLILVYIGLNRLKILNQDTEEKNISIVIAARNEEDRIRPCLQSLEKLDYNPDKFEVIFIDDCSEDNTASIIQEYASKHDNWSFIQITERNGELHGKKNALLNGIANARGDIIFTTDSDCVVPELWLKRMVNYFRPGVSMVLGYSPLERGKSFLRKILEFDNLFSAVSASAPTKMGYPFTSVGRNLAYRKESYDSAGGFLALKQFRSGDDVHLTERFRMLDNGIIEYCPDPHTFVITKPPQTSREIFDQQIRKNSKALKKTTSSILFSVLLFLFYILYLMLPVLKPDLLQPWIIITIMKFLLEFVDLYKAAVIFQQRHLSKYILLMQIIYPFYIIFFSFLGIFQLYRWKR